MFPEMLTFKSNFEATDFASALPFTLVNEFHVPCFVLWVKPHIFTISVSKNMQNSHTKKSQNVEGGSEDFTTISHSKDNAMKRDRGSEKKRTEIRVVPIYNLKGRSCSFDQPPLVGGAGQPPTPSETSMTSFTDAFFNQPSIDIRKKKLRLKKTTDAKYFKYLEGREKNFILDGVYVSTLSEAYCKMNPKLQFALQPYNALEDPACHRYFRNLHVRNIIRRTLATVPKRYGDAIGGFIIEANYDKENRSGLLAKRNVHGSGRHPLTYKGHNWDYCHAIDTFGCISPRKLQFDEISLDEYPSIGGAYENCKNRCDCLFQIYLGSPPFRGTGDIANPQRGAKIIEPGYGTFFRKPSRRPTPRSRRYRRRQSARTPRSKQVHYRMYHVPSSQSLVPSYQRNPNSEAVESIASANKPSGRNSKLSQGGRPSACSSGPQSGRLGGRQSANSRMKPLTRKTVGSRGRSSRRKQQKSRMTQDTIQSEAEFDGQFDQSPYRNDGGHSPHVPCGSFEEEEEECEFSRGPESGDRQGQQSFDRGHNPYDQQDEDGYDQGRNPYNQSGEGDYNQDGEDYYDPDGEDAFEEEDEEGRGKMSDLKEVEEAGYGGSTVIDGEFKQQSDYAEGDSFATVEDEEDIDLGEGEGNEEDANLAGGDQKSASEDGDGAEDGEDGENSENISASTGAENQGEHGGEDDEEGDQTKVAGDEEGESDKSDLEEDEGDETKVAAGKDVEGDEGEDQGSAAIKGGETDDSTVGEDDEGDGSAAGEEGDHGSAVTAEQGRESDDSGSAAHYEGASRNLSLASEDEQDEGEDSEEPGSQLSDSNRKKNRSKGTSKASTISSRASSESSKKLGCSMGRENRDDYAPDERGCPVLMMAPVDRLTNREKVGVESKSFIRSRKSPDGTIEHEIMKTQNHPIVSDVMENDTLSDEELNAIIDQRFKDIGAITDGSEDGGGKHRTTISTTSQVRITSTTSHSKVPADGSAFKYSASVPSTRHSAKADMRSVGALTAPSYHQPKETKIENISIRGKSPNQMSERRSNSGRSQPAFTGHGQVVLVSGAPSKSHSKTSHLSQDRLFSEKGHPLERPKEVPRFLSGSGKSTSELSSGPPITISHIESMVPTRNETLERPASRGSQSSKGASQSSKMTPSIVGSNSTNVALKFQRSHSQKVKSNKILSHVYQAPRSKTTVSLSRGSVTPTSQQRLLRQSMGSTGSLSRSSNKSSRASSGDLLNLSLSRQGNFVNSIRNGSGSRSQSRSVVRNYLPSDRSLPPQANNLPDVVGQKTAASSRRSSTISKLKHIQGPCAADSGTTIPNSSQFKTIKSDPMMLLRVDKPQVKRDASSTDGKFHRNQSNSANSASNNGIYAANTTISRNTTTEGGMYLRQYSRMRDSYSLRTSPHKSRLRDSGLSGTPIEEFNTCNVDGAENVDSRALPRDHSKFSLLEKPICPEGFLYDNELDVCVPKLFQSITDGGKIEGKDQKQSVSGRSKMQRSNKPLSNEKLTRSQSKESGKRSSVKSMLQKSPATDSIEKPPSSSKNLSQNLFAASSNEKLPTAGNLSQNLPPSIEKCESGSKKSSKRSCAADSFGKSPSTKMLSEDTSTVSERQPTTGSSLPQSSSDNTPNNANLSRSLFTDSTKTPSIGSLPQSLSGGNINVSNIGNSQSMLPGATTNAANLSQSLFTDSINTRNVGNLPASTSGVSAHASSLGTSLGVSVGSTTASLVSGNSSPYSGAPATSSLASPRQLE